MRTFRSAFVGLGIILLALAVFTAWRAARPVQSEEQLLLAWQDAAVSAIQNRSVARVSKYLAPEFTWNGTSRSELKQMMTGAFWQWRDVQLQLISPQATVSGEQATTSGRFILTHRAGPDAAVESNQGSFTLQWRKKDGQWQVVAASGGDDTR